MNHICKTLASCSKFIAWARFWVAWIVFCHAPIVLQAQLPTSVLHDTSRQAAQIGSTTRVAVRGEPLQEVSGLVISNTLGETVRIDVEPILVPLQPLQEWQATTGEFDLTLPGDLSPGLMDVRCFGRLGISNPRAFLISKLPVVVSDRDNTTVENAFPIHSGQIINESTVPLKSRTYRVSLSPGQALDMVAYGKPLDSQAELNVKLTDLHGHVLARGRSIGHWPAELRWEHQKEEPQDFILEVSDLLSRGGAQLGYRFNYVLEVQTNGEPLHLDELLRPRIDSDRAVELGPEQTQISVENFPALIRGSLHRPIHVDFHAEQGQTLVFDVASAKLRQLTDPALVLYKVALSEKGGPPQLSPVGEVDDGPYVGTAAVRVRQADPSWTWTAPEGGDYRLLVFDNQSGDRPDDSLGFVLSIGEPEPSFSILAYREFSTNDPALSRPWGSNLMRSGTESIHVTLLRRAGFAGPVEFHLEGLPEGCRSEPVIVNVGATEGRLVIQASETIAGAVVPLSVVGKARVGEVDLHVEATPFTILAATTPVYNAVQSRQCAAIDLALVSSDTAPMQIQAGEGKTIVAKPGDKVALPVKLSRTAGSSAECILRPQDLPPKTSLGEIKIAGDQTEGSGELAIAADAPAGEYTFGLLAESKVKWRVNPQALEREQEYLGRLQAALQQLDSDTHDTAERVTPSHEFTKEQLEAAVATANARIEQLKASTAEQEIALWLPSNTLRVRIENP